MFDPCFQCGECFEFSVDFVEIEHDVFLLGLHGSLHVFFIVRVVRLVVKRSVGPVFYLIQLVPLTGFPFKGWSGFGVRRGLGGAARGGSTRVGPCVALGRLWRFLGPFDKAEEDGFVAVFFVLEEFE